MPSELFTLNPTRRRRRKTTKRPAAKRRRRRSAAKAMAAPATRTYRRKRRARRGKTTTKRKLSLKNYMAQMQDGLLNGAGAFASDITLGFVRPMLPDALAFGMGRHFVRAGIGLLLGNVVGQYINPKFGNAITTGTVTVTGYEFMKEFVQPMLPAGIVLGEYVDDMGEYVNPVNQDQLGYVSSAPNVMNGGGATQGEKAYYSAYN